MISDDYELLDAGDGRKLERFGRYTLSRPCAQALWRPARPSADWERADAAFDREDGNRWHGRTNLPAAWQIRTAGVTFRLSGTDFGHLGIFPEQRAQWRWIRETLSRRPRARVLNLFAYSGGSTLAAALGGADVCHLDASKGMVDWARENAALNGLSDHPIRWIVDDAHKFMRREVRRARRYDAIILDPPTFGRGAGGELYKIERDLKETLSLVRSLLSETPLFVLFSSHTPGLSPIVAENILGQLFPAAHLSSGEMLLEGAALSCPSGIYCRAVWEKGS
jgi:23S rRNA (cytosine1962-C5)-methyltransferase